MNKNYQFTECIKNIIRQLSSKLPLPELVYLIGELFFRIIARRTHPKEISLGEAKRVLVVQFDEIGDVVLLTSFLRELRRNLPSSWITLIVKPIVYNLVEPCPYVNEVLLYSWTSHKHFLGLQWHGRLIPLVVKHLWPKNFDLAIVPKWDADFYLATFISYLSGSLWRVGYSEKVTQKKQLVNRGYDRLLTHIIEDTSLKHEVEHNLDIIRFLKGIVKEEQLELWFTSEDEKFINHIVASYDLKRNDLLIAFAPGARETKRMWPISRFIELGLWLKAEYNLQILVVGGTGEQELGLQLEQTLGSTVVNLVGQTTLRQTAMLLKCCKLFIGNDSSPMHLAATSGVPIIEISCHSMEGSPLHNNSPTRFGPWGVPNVVIQPDKASSPCQEGCIADKAHCILGISVEQVKEAAKSLLISKYENSKEIF